MTSHFLIGSHVSMSGKKMLIQAAEESIANHANTLMIFTGAPQNTRRKAIADFQIHAGQELLKQHEISPIVVHAPYIINFANTVKKGYQDFARQFMQEELERAEALGASQISFHPGAHVGAGPEKAIQQLAESLRYLFDQTETKKVHLAIETMAGKGTEIGTTFKQMAQILHEAGDDPRIGVTLDTCHVYDAGYDLKNDLDAVLSEFDEQIGLDKIGVIHLNDSKFGLNSHKDRHANLGAGKIGFEALYRLAHLPVFEHVPKILETPWIPVPESKKIKVSPYQREIEMLRSGNFDSNWQKELMAVHAS